MSKKVSLTIDGKAVTVPEGTNLIDAADSVGIHIPNLCYLKGMRGIGACRLCLIELEGGKAPVVGCITKVKEGMVVKTSTERILEMRKFIIDLILSMHPLDCMTCTKAGVCNLQQYAYDFEIRESSLTRKKFGYPIDEANPFIKRDPDYCILCGRCVRVCKEQGTNVLDFMGRGVGAKVATAMDKPLQESACTFCGSCVDACPVNALLEADRWRKGREWEYEKIPTVCLSCGNGCDIVASAKDGTVVKISAGAPEGSAERYICAVGRFGFDALSSDSRVTVPMKRVGKSLEETTWKDALAIVSEKLKKAGKDACIISSAGILNQDASVLSKLASGVIKTKNIDTTASLYADAESLQLSDSADVDTADLFVLAGLDPTQWERISPALDAVLRKRVARRAKIIVIHENETKIGSLAEVNMRGDEAQALSMIARSLMDGGAKASKELESAVSGARTDEESAKAAELLSGASSPVLFCAPSLFRAAKNLSLLKPVSVLAVPLEANARGVLAAGLVTNGKTYEEMLKGKCKSLYIVGEVPVAKRPNTDFLVVQTSYMNEIARHADVVLPSATYLESKGSMTDYLGRTKEVKRVVHPPGSARQHRDIIIELSKIMGKPVKESAVKAKRATRKTAKPKPAPFKKQKELDINVPRFVDSLFRPAVERSRLLWLKETEKAAV